MSVVLGALLIVTLGVAVPVLGEVTVGLVPSSPTVPPGEEFDVSIVVSQAGSPFNAFEAIVGYDPAVLTRLPLSPLSLQEGALMTAACATRFHLFRTGSDRDTITESLLCNQVFVTGPGQIYRLRFRASTTPQTTTIRFLPGLDFYDAGIQVTPASSSDATVVIQASVDVPNLREGGVGTRLRVGPNPGRGGAAAWLEARLDGFQELVVHDISGRTVRRLLAGYYEAGRRSVYWDGLDQSGAPVSEGIYLLEFRAGGETARAKLALLR